MAQYWGTGRLGLAQSVTYTGTLGVSTAVGSASSGVIQKIRVVTTSAAYISIGSTATAVTSTNGSYMPADSPEYFSCANGEKVQAVQVSASGTLNVTEIP